MELKRLLISYILHSSNISTNCHVKFGCSSNGFHHVFTITSTKCETISDWMSLNTIWQMFYNIYIELNKTWNSAIFLPILLWHHFLFVCFGICTEGQNINEKQATLSDHDASFYKLTFIEMQICRKYFTKDGFSTRFFHPFFLKIPFQLFEAKKKIICFFAQ